MRSIIRMKFCEDFGDMAFHRVFGNRKPDGDLLVGITSSNQPEHLDLACCQVVLLCVLGQLGCYFRRNSL